MGFTSFNPSYGLHKFDTHFYVGKIHRHPKEWIIVGLFYPPYPVVRDLFD
jgi:hypothetical protein